MKNQNHFVKNIVSLWILMSVIFTFGCFFSSKLKTDQQLIDEFQLRKDKLNQLVKMLQDDNQLREEQMIFINAESLRKQGIKEERIGEYEKACIGVI